MFTGNCAQEQKPSETRVFMTIMMTGDDDYYYS